MSEEECERLEREEDEKEEEEGKQRRRNVLEDLQHNPWVASIPRLTSKTSL